MPTLYDNFERVRQYIDQHQGGGGDMSAYVTKDELSAQSYATTSDLNDYLPLEGGTITGRLVSTYYNTSSAIGGIDSYSSVIVGGDDRNSVTMVATRRLCGDTSYAAAFFTNSDGRSKFTHKTKTGQYAIGGSDDAFMCFNAYGFKIAYSGEQGVGATTEYEILHEGNIGNLGYVTKDELSAQSYLTSIPNTYASYNGVYSYLYDTLGISHGGSQGVSYIEDAELHNAELSGVTLINGISTDELPTYAAISNMGYISAVTEGNFDSVVNLEGTSKIAAEDGLEINAGDDFIYLNNQTFVDDTLSSSNIIPQVTNTYTLGDSNNYYDYIYVNRLNFPSTGGWLRTGTNPRVFVSTTALRPFDSTIGLGTSSVKWGTTYTTDLYADTANLQDTSYTKSIVPAENNTYTLGDSSHIYAATYTNEIKWGTTRIYNDSNSVTFSVNNYGGMKVGQTHFSPRNGGHYTLGTTSSVWESTYTTNIYADNAYISNYNNLIWTGTSAEYAALSDYTTYQIYMIKEA